MPVAWRIHVLFVLSSRNDYNVNIEICLEVHCRTSIERPLMFTVCIQRKLLMITDQNLFASECAMLAVSDGFRDPDACTVKVPVLS